MGPGVVCQSNDQSLSLNLLGRPVLENVLAAKRARLSHEDVLDGVHAIAHLPEEENGPLSHYSRTQNSDRNSTQYNGTAV